MKASELRIGNYIDLGKVIEITENRVTVLRSEITGLIESYPLLSTNPIPLTHEILEKAGFERDLQFSETFTETYHVNINCHFELIAFDDYFVFHTIAPNLQIKYLHQLQNLYFALTGEELDIKL